MASVKPIQNDFDMSSFGLWRPPGADFWGVPTPGSLALRASVTGGYECAALRAKMNLLFGLIAGRQVPRNVVLASRPNVSDASAYYTERDYQTLNVVWSKNWSPQLYTPISLLFE